MRFGCCGNLASKNPDGTGIEIIEDVARLGFDYIELPIAEMTALSDDDFDALKKRVEDSGIRCEVCNNLFPSSIRLTGENADFSVIGNYLEKALFRAHVLGAEYVVFGSGGAKRVPEGFPFDRAYEQVVETGRLIASIAGKYGISVVIEPIRKPECNIINTFKEGVELSDRVNEPNVKVLVDFYHMTWENENPDVLVTYGDYLKHVHFANPNLSSPKGRIYPDRIEEFDYIPFINALKKSGYDSRISIEAGFKSEFASEASKAIAFMKKYFN